MAKVKVNIIREKIVSHRTAKGNESCIKWAMVVVVQYYCTNMCLHFDADFVACQDHQHSPLFPQIDLASSSLCARVRAKCKINWFFIAFRVFPSISQHFYFNCEYRSVKFPTKATRTGSVSCFPCLSLPFLSFPRLSFFWQ